MEPHVAPTPTWDGIGDGPPKNLMLAAVAEFSVRGYHATTTRSIAQKAALSPAALYVHFPSKAELLYEICVLGHRGVKRAVDEAVARADSSDAEKRLHHLVEALVGWHVDNRVLARVIQTELRSLEPESYESVAQLRRQLEQRLRNEVLLRHASFDRHPAELSLTTTAAWSLVIDLTRWHRDRSLAAHRRFVDAYVALILRMLANEANSIRASRA